MGLIEELIRQGVEVTLFHRTGQPPHAEHVAELDCRIVGLDAPKAKLWEQAAVPLALWRGKFDVWHAPFERGVPLVAPCPVVLTVHSVTSYSYADMVRRGQLPGPVRTYLGSDFNRWSFENCYWRAQVARASHILTPSEFSRQEVIRFLGVPSDRVTTTPLAVPAQFRRPARPEADRAVTLARLGVRKPYLLFVGGYEPHKNVGGLLETFALVRAVRPELSLVLVGTGPVPEAVRYAAKLRGLHPGRHVVLLNNLTDELTDLYDDAELLVTLSWRETFCLPLLEAMSRGIPAVASAWGATPEVAMEGSRLVDPRDPAAAREAILDLLANGAGRAPYRDAIRAQARRFDWQQTAAQTLAVYRRLVEPR